MTTFLGKFDEHFVPCYSLENFYNIEEEQNQFFNLVSYIETNLPFQLTENGRWKLSSVFTSPEKSNNSN